MYYHICIVNMISIVHFLKIKDLVNTYCYSPNLNSPILVIVSLCPLVVVRSSQIIVQIHHSNCDIISVHSR